MLEKRGFLMFPGKVIMEPSTFPRPQVPERKVNALHVSRFSVHSKAQLLISLDVSKEAKSSN